MDGPDYWPNSQPLAIKHKSEANEEEEGVSTSQEEGMGGDGFRISCICQAPHEGDPPMDEEWVSYVKIFAAWQ